MISFAKSFTRKKIDLANPNKRVSLSLSRCINSHSVTHVHNVYNFPLNTVLAIILWLCNMLFLVVTRKLHIKYLVKSSLPVMFCIKEGIDGGKRKQRHLLKSASNGLVGASEFNGFRSFDKPVSSCSLDCLICICMHYCFYTIFKLLYST